MILKYFEFPPSQQNHIRLDDETVSKLYGDIEDRSVRLREIGRQVGSTLCRVVEDSNLGQIIDMADGLKEGSAHLWYTPDNEVPFLHGVIEGVLFTQQYLGRENERRLIA